jgi:hypothetical protein
VDLPIGDLLDRLRQKGLEPVQAEPGTWIATCPLCHRRCLMAVWSEERRHVDLRCREDLLVPL